MSLLAARAVFAEALGVGLAIFCGGLFVDVQEDTVASIIAFSVLRPKVASWHLGQFVAMEELTISVLLAQRIEPMFANGRLDLHMEVRAFEVAAFALRKVSTDLTYIN